MGVRMRSFIAGVLAALFVRGLHCLVRSTFFEFSFVRSIVPPVESLDCGDLGDDIGEHPVMPIGFQ